LAALDVLNGHLTASGTVLESGLWPVPPPQLGVLVTVSELEELGARRGNTDVPGAEIDEHSDISLNTDNRAEAVLVVVHPIL
jgi:hypothetical protein